MWIKNICRSSLCLGFIVLIALLFVPETNGYCDIENIDENSDKLTCVGSIETEYIESEYVDLYNYHIDTISLRNINDVAQTLEVINSMSKVNGIYEIELSESNITAIPNDLLAVRRLVALQLANNKISSVNLNILPFSHYLERLNISHNLIRDFDTEFTEYTSTKKLKTIDLSYNEMERVPHNSFYSTRESLEILDLSYNQISSFDFYAFSSLTKLGELRLSHNKLVHIGFFLYPIKTVAKLYLDHNEIQKIGAEVFDQSTRLQNLDLSYNYIELVEDGAFKSLTELADINLSNNNIQSIRDTLFRNNSFLKSINLAFNNLSYIEPGSFASINMLTYLGVEHALAVPIQEHIFDGVKSSVLNFSGSTINNVEGRAFISLGSNLLTLNLSFCSIHDVSETAFETLSSLEELDLAYNNLTKVSFNTANLKNLSKLYLNDNSIQELRPESFHNLLSLIELNLSNNQIRRITPMTFKNLKMVEIFKIHKNELESALLSNTFFGLENVGLLELMETNVMRWESYAFSGLKSLKILNASHGILSHIDYYALTGTGNIEILDLSNNKLQNFNVKLLLNKNMKELYLSNNQLGNILKNAFEELYQLEILNLSNNNIVTIDTTAFSSFTSLSHLDLSFNPNIEVGRNVFDYLNLQTLNMRNVSNHVSYEFNKFSTKNLDLSSSQICNVSSLHLHNIKGLEYVDLTQNIIKTVDQFSLRDVMFLKTLNLSQNIIENVSPGTFFEAKELRSLDLSYNKLERIQFGAMRGPNQLQTLNLTNNIINSFKLNLLYDMQHLKELFLDNNTINQLDLSKNFYNLEKLSIGGNKLLCDNIVTIKMQKDSFSQTLTAEKLEYFVENIDGIACSSDTSNISLGEDLQ